MKYGTLKPRGYMPRIADGQLSHMLEIFGAVEVAGTMWCGKTWTSLAFGESVTRIGLAGPRTAAEADPSMALLGVRPHVVDDLCEASHNSSNAKHRVMRSGRRRRADACA